MLVAVQSVPALTVSVPPLLTVILEAVLIRQCAGLVTVSIPPFTMVLL